MSSKQVVELREVTAETVRTICSLEVTDMQKNFVAPNAISISQAYFEPNAWFRAIYADETPVGFLMTFEDSQNGFYYLWRFMVAHEHQGKGYGRVALSQLIERVQQQPKATELKLSVVPSNEQAIRFYEAAGFEFTGLVEHGENVYAKALI